jgi:hydroxymethylpyrimidine/phosphomethylpyrimidine kinase
MSQYRLPCVLAVSGSDSSAGAGLQADLKTCAALRVYAATAVTAITAQNSLGVSRVEPVSASMVKQQMLSVLEDLPVSAVKIGMLADAGVVDAVCDVLDQYADLPVVLDPVLISSSGRMLLDAAGQASLVKRLLPLATVLTPNIMEAAHLLGLTHAKVESDPESAVRLLAGLGARSVLLKGGHRSGVMCEDLLWSDEELHRFTVQRLDVKNNHGTGCTLASAIAAGLAKGLSVPLSVKMAKAYITESLATADQFELGRGHGSLNHFGWTMQP